MRRLDRTEQNRQRLADIVGEVAARLETVKKQASRARRWKRMTEKLQSLRFAAASAVPPVAIKSSMINTLSFSFKESL